jgi:WD40 repeat protein
MSKQDFTVGSQPCLLQGVQDLFGDEEVQPSGRLFSLAISADGSVLAMGDEAGGIFAWDLLSGHGPARVGTVEASVEQLIFMPDGATLACGDDEGAITTWSLPDRAMIRSRPRAHERGIYAAAVTREGYLLTGALDGHVKAWEATSLELVRDAFSTRHGVLSLNLGTKYLHAGNVSGKISCWNGIDSEPVFVSRIHRGPVFAIRDVNGSGLLASCGQESIVQFWEAGSGSVVGGFEAGQGKVLDLLVFPTSHPCSSNMDGETFNLATAGGDGTIKTWQVDSGDLSSAVLVSSTRAHDRTVEKIVLDSARRSLYSVSSDGSAKKWGY